MRSVIQPAIALRRQFAFSAGACLAAVLLHGGTALAQERVHNPANDARGCIALVPNEGSTSGSLQMQNNCGYPVSVLWPGGLVGIAVGGSYPSFRNSRFTFHACRSGGGAGLYQSSEMAARNEIICHDAPGGVVESLKSSYDRARALYDKVKSLYDKYKLDPANVYVKRNDAYSEPLNQALDDAKNAVLGVERQLIDRSEIVTTIQDAAFDRLKSQVQQLRGDLAALEAAIAGIGASQAAAAAEPPRDELPRRRASTGGALFNDAISKAEQAERERPAREAAEREARARAARAEAALTPEQRINRDFDKRISAASEQCTAAESSCQKSCVGIAALGILSLLSRSTAGANAASEQTEQCSNRCTEAKSSCDEQVASLEREKTQAISDLSPRPAAAVAGGAAGARTCEDALNSLFVHVNDPRNTPRTAEQVFMQSVWAMQMYMRAANTIPACANDSASREKVAAALRKEQENCRRGRAPNCVNGQDVAGLTAGAEAAIQRLMREPADNRGNAAASAGTGADCAAALDQQEAEFQSVVQRIRSTSNVVTSSQLALGMMSRRMALLDRLCKGQPQYAQYAATKQSYDSTLRSCRGMASNPADCAPK